MPTVDIGSSSSRCMKYGVMKKTVPMAVAAAARATCGPTSPGERKRSRTAPLVGSRSQMRSNGTVTSARVSQAGPLLAVKERATSTAATAVLSTAASVSQARSGSRSRGAGRQRA